MPGLCLTLPDLSDCSRPFPPLKKAGLLQPCHRPEDHNVLAEGLWAAPNRNTATGPPGPGLKQQLLPKVGLMPSLHGRGEDDRCPFTEMMTTRAEYFPKSPGTFLISMSCASTP